MPSYIKKKSNKPWANDANSSVKSRRNGDLKLGLKVNKTKPYAKMDVKNMWPTEHKMERVLIIVEPKFMKY